MKGSNALLWLALAAPVVSFSAVRPALASLDHGGVAVLKPCSVPKNVLVPNCANDTDKGDDSIWVLGILGAIMYVGVYEILVGSQKNSANKGR